MTERVKRYWTKLYYVTVERLRPESITADVEVVLASDYDALMKEASGLAAHQCETPAGDDYGNFYCVKVRDLQAKLAAVEAHHDTVVMDMAASLKTVKARAEQAEADRDRLRGVLEEMVLRFDDAAPKDCQPLAYKQAALERAEVALAGQEDKR